MVKLKFPKDVGSYMLVQKVKFPHLVPSINIVKRETSFQILTSFLVSCGSASFFLPNTAVMSNSQSLVNKNIARQLLRTLNMHLNLVQQLHCIIQNFRYSNPVFSWLDGWSPNLNLVTPTSSKTFTAAIFITLHLKNCITNYVSHKCSVTYMKMFIIYWAF